MMLFYTVVMASVLMLALWAFRSDPVANHDLLLTSALVCLSALLCAIITSRFGLLNTALVSPALDFALAMFVYDKWLKNHEKWRLVILGCLVSQLTLHATIIVLWDGGTLTPHSLVLYVWEVNTVFCIMLATLSLSALNKIKQARRSVVPAPQGFWSRND